MSQRPVRHPERVRDEVVALFSDASIVRRIGLRRTWSKHVGAEIESEVPTSGRILEVGSGNGFFSLYLASMCPGRVVTGIEQAGPLLAMARGAAANLSLATVYFSARIPDHIPDGPWDGIVLVDQLGTDVESALALIDGCVEALGPDGVLVVAETTAASVARRPPSTVEDMAEHLTANGLAAQARRLPRRATRLRNVLVARR